MSIAALLGVLVGMLLTGQPGMLSERQRRTAVPRLLEFAEDWSLDPETRKWVFQALRDITSQTLAHDASAWRQWYTASNPRWNPVTRDGRQICESVSLVQTVR